MTRPVPSLTISFVLAAATLAQGTVSPPHFAHVEGPASFVAPISAPYPGDRLMQVDANLMGAPRTIHGIRFRRDAYAWQSTSPAAIVATVHLCDAATTPSTVSPTFAQNCATTPQQVFGSTLALRATAQRTLPEPFEFDIPFQQPFVYAGTAPLCWDLRVTASNAINYVDFDCVTQGNGNPAPAGIEFGTGCTLAANAYPIHLGGSAFPNWPGTPSDITFVYGASELAQNSGSFPNPGSAALLSFGLGRSPAPATIPGSACDLLIQPLAWQILFVAPGGTLTNNYSFVLPVLPVHNGADLCAQLFTLDPGNGSVAASNGHQFNIAAPFGPPQIGIGMVFGSVSGPVGTVWPDAGVIVEYY